MHRVRAAFSVKKHDCDTESARARKIWLTPLVLRVLKRPVVLGYEA